MPRINRRAFIRASGGAATIGLMAGCSGDGGDGGGGDGGDGDGGDGGDGDGGDGGSTGTPGGSAEPIVIGALEPISGPFAQWAEPHQAGLEFAINEINNDGGVLGRELTLEVADTGADPAEADSAFRRIVEQEDAVATTGAVSSDVGIRVSQTAEDVQVPHFLNRAGSSKVISENSQYIFRMNLHPGPTYMQAQASAFSDAGYTKIGAVIADYAWGHSTRTGIEEHFETDVQIEVAPVGASDFASHLRRFPDDLEMLIGSGHPPGCISIANQAFDLGLSPDVVTGAHNEPRLLTNALSDQALEVFAHVHNSDPYTDEFAEIGQRFGEARDLQFSTDTAYGYSTAKLIAQGIEDAGAADPTAIADAIRAITFDTLYAQPYQVSEHGELKDASVIFSRLRKEAPSWDADGGHRYEELFRSDPIPALPADQ